MSIRDYVLFYLGKNLLHLQRCREARDIFQELLTSYPDSRWGALAEIQVRSPEECPALDSIPAISGPARCEMETRLMDRADCYFKSRQYSKAKELYRVTVEAGGTPKMFIRLSQAAARSQDFDTAIWANQTLRRRFPKSSEAREALRKIAFLYQDARRFSEAIEALQDILRQSRAASEKRMVWERTGWGYFQLEDYSKAIEAFDHAIDEGETAHSLYWKARSLERLGRHEEAQPILHNILTIYPGTYYGLRSLERLYRNGAPPRDLLSGWWTPMKGLTWRKNSILHDNSRELQRVVDLQSLGLLSDARVELRRARIRFHLNLPKDPKDLAIKEDGIHVVEKQVTSEHSDYPLPHADFLFGMAKKHDAFLVYAMMKQESQFRDWVVSPAGAVGLLQIMPGTGRKLAREAGWDGFEPHWLYDPLTNIELSIRYLTNLSELFSGKWYPMVASYNAGERVVSEWLKQRPGLPEDEFIEEIPYQETRNYVKKVYTNWKAYRFIYGAKN